MKAQPKMDKYMTPMPHTIGNDIPMSKAYDLMREGNYRHLPVQHGGKLVGILTDRDIKLASSFAGNDEDFLVEDIMNPEVYTCQPDAKLDEVVSEMAERKLGSCVVQQANGKVVGIFTATDGLTTLAEVLRQRFHA